MCAEAALARGSKCNVLHQPADAAAAAATGVQHAVLLSRRLLKRGAQPPTDADLATDAAHSAAAAAAVGLLHGRSLLGVTHALPQVLFQMHHLPAASVVGALAPHLLDWLWRTAQSEANRAAGRTDGWGAPLAGLEEATEEDGSDDDAAALPRSHLQYLDVVARLLRATLRDVSRGVIGAEGTAVSDQPPFAAIWRSIFNGGLAPGTPEERAHVLAPPMALSRAERGLLAATAELHDSALAAPIVPSLQDLSALLGAMLPPAEV